MGDFLNVIEHEHGILIHCFVLMTNHFHLLATAPRANISSAMNYFMRETSREITRLSGRINQTYGARHHKCLVSSYHYYMNVYKYVYRNPVRAGLCDRVENYPYSTLSGLVGKFPLHIPLAEDTLLFNPTLEVGNILWLNSVPRAEHEEQIRKGLRRAVFSLATDRKTGRACELETALL